jgi:hypothetical protein
MATVVNDRDVLIMAATPRFTPPTNRAMVVTPSTAVFKVSADGKTASPSSFDFKASLINLAGTVSWSWTGGMSPSINGNVATLSFASFSAVSGTLTATITVDGQVFTQVATVTKVVDGATGAAGANGTNGTNGSNGAAGQRGNIDITTATTSHAWSDSEAVTAIAAAGFGAPMNRDLVRLYNSDQTFSVQKAYDGAQWITVSYVYDGSVFVKESILAASVNTRGMDIKDAAGNVTFAAGTSLAQQAAVNANLVPRLSSWALTGAPSAAVGLGIRDSRFLNGEYLYLPNSADYRAGTTPVSVPQNYPYTVSFDAYCTGASSSLVVDVVGPNGIDTDGIVVNLTGTFTRYSFTESINNPSSTQCTLRAFSTTSGSDIIVTNVKFELGVKVTPWCDNVITKANASTYIRAAAIGLAFIDTASIGTLSALSALLGSARIGPGGSLSEGQTAFDTGDGFWFEGAGQGHGARASIGSSTGSKIVMDPANGIFKLVNPQYQSSFNATITNTQGSYYWTVGRNTNGAYAGTYTANPANGVGGYSYSWSLSNPSAGTIDAWINGSTSNQQVGLYVYGHGITGEFDIYLQCTVTDVGGNVVRIVQQLTTVNFT